MFGQKSTGLADQAGAWAGSDLTGRDKITNTTTNNTYVAESRRTQIDYWMQKLDEEMKNNVHAQNLVDSLQYFYDKHAPDGIDGLEAKLDHAGRNDEIYNALRKKELFSKLLSKFSLYGSAQEIFAYLLFKIESLFSSEVHPYVDTLPKHEIDKLIVAKVIQPVLQEIGESPFLINHGHAAGMVYWLAEQCFIRWHK